MSIFKKKLKIGQKVAVIAYSRNNNRDEFRTGKVVAMRPQEDGNPWDRNYAVRFDDEKIEVFRAQELYTKWGEEAE